MLFNGKRVLVPVDGTPASEAGFRWACRLINRSGALLHAVYVTEMGLEFPLTTEFVPENTPGESVLARVEAIASAEKCQVRAQLLQARHAGPAIVEEAEDRRMDLIVLGVPHRNRLGVAPLTETAAYLLEHARCQVVLCREPIEPPGQSQGDRFQG